MKQKQIVRFFFLLVLAYLLTLAGIYVFQRHFLFFPSATYETPQAAHANPRFSEMDVTTEDGLKLKAWYAPPTTKKETIVFFHGNATYLSSAAPWAAPYLAAGYGFYIVEYRGYSGMPGAPSETGLYADASAAINALKARGVSEDNMIFWGHSLGTGVAVQMARVFHPRGLILLAPFLSISDMAQVRFPYFPVKYLTRDRFDSSAKIKDLHVPLLLANGGLDRVVPVAQGRALYALANEPKQYYFDPQGAHSDMFDRGFDKIVMEWMANNSL